MGELNVFVKTGATPSGCGIVTVKDAVTFHPKLIPVPENSDDPQGVLFVGISPDSKTVYRGFSPKSQTFVMEYHSEGSAYGIYTTGCLTSSDESRILKKVITGDYPPLTRELKDLPTTAQDWLLL